MTTDKQNQMDGYKDEETLKELYGRQGLSHREIASRFDVSKTTVADWINKYGIDKADPPYQDEETLEDLYWGEGLSQREIASRFGVTEYCIYSNMKDFNIETRRSNREKPPSYEIGSHGYYQWSHRVDGEQHRVLEHRLTAVAKYGFDAVVDKDIHHLNTFKLDNRPENLLPIDRSTHGRLSHRPAHIRELWLLAQTLEK